MKTQSDLIIEQKNTIIAEFLGGKFVALRENSDASTSSGFHDRCFDTIKECQIFCDGINSAMKGNDIDRTLFKPFHIGCVMKYDTSWDWQIPAWAKVLSMIDTNPAKRSDFFSSSLRTFHKAVEENNPELGFQNLHSVIIDFLNIKLESE